MKRSGRLGAAIRGCMFVRRGGHLLAALLLGSGVVPVPAQQGSPEQATPQRPRIGLALSGGGARGAAHIGVLSVLEQLRVPVHCITGTSMGAVVGGAYAAGTTPAEMQRVIEAIDWSDVFTDRPPRAEIAPRRKIDDYKPLFAPEFGFRDGSLLLPRGVVAGVTIEGFLRQLSAPAVEVSDFSRLPIPFRAIAADIATGEEVVLEQGSLMRAMRASMAIPGAVTPVEIDGRLLVDGGIANNLPIDVARKVCADVVIAVNIATPPFRRDEIQSAASIVGQLISFLGKATVDRQIASLTERDVLIAPDLGTISAGSFDRQSEAMKVGEAAALAAADTLRRYSLPDAEYAALRQVQGSPDTRLGKVDAIRFEGIERTNAEVLSELLESRPGTELTEEQVGADLRRIYGRGDFEAVDYRIEQGANGRALVIPVREKSIGPDYVRFGLGFAADLEGQARFNALVSYRRTWLNRAGGEWLTEAQVGTDNYLFTEFYQPFERRGRFFVAPYAQVDRSVVGVFFNDQRVADYRVQGWRLGVDLGATLDTWGELRVGPLFRDVKASVVTGDPVLPDASVRTSGIAVRLFGDRLDTPWFPRSGHRTLATMFIGDEATGTHQEYRRLAAHWSGAASRGEHTVTATLQGGTDLGSVLPAYEAFTLGGPFQLSGYQIGQFAGASSAFASLRYYRRILRLPSLLGSGVFAGASAELGRVRDLYDGRATTGTLWSGSIYLAAETFLGPGFLGIGVGGDGNRALYLLLGAP